MKKVYFPDYRFSEDLDFTFTGNDFDIKTIKNAFGKLIDWVYEESRISLSIQNETQHETGNFNFYLAYIGPLGGTGANKDIKVDICPDELIYNVPEEKLIINLFSDMDQEYSILCYSLGEVIAEKMRSIMQRTAPRDIYDLWFLFEIDGQNIEDHIFAFQDKAAHKGFDPDKLLKVIQQKEKIYSKHWNEHLSNQMTAIPDFKDVWRELGKHWRKFQKFIE
ncbi:MAG: nucleotidyl transferase AbiEii/AbiGii toxin family protein [Bacteroidales bacterium]|nr:nucleotidyl transferase AbiEii/AbiGii toxin family protein [Bacteroidales bacterium]